MNGTDQRACQPGMDAQDPHNCPCQPREPQREAGHATNVLSPGHFPPIGVCPGPFEGSMRCSERIPQKPCEHRSARECPGDAFACEWFHISGGVPDTKDQILRHIPSGSRQTRGPLPEELRQSGHLGKPCISQDSCHERTDSPEGRTATGRRAAAMLSRPSSRATRPT